MQTYVLDTKEATNKWWAARDAAQRSYAASTHYKDSQKVQAERMKLALELVYVAKCIHINFRQRFIAIKLDNAMPKDRKTLKLLEADWEKIGVIKLESAQGITYRLPKQ